MTPDPMPTLKTLTRAGIGSATVTEDPAPELVGDEGAFDAAFFDRAVFETGGGFEREAPPATAAISEE